MTQSADNWTDAGAFRHGIFCVDVRDFDASVHIYVETADVDEEDAFVTLIDHQPAAAGRTYFTVKAADATPVLRYVRWKVGDGSGTWKVVFRILATYKTAA